MLVSCPKCTSRYQLGDDKIKAAGTKVRCPRCQNTFKVFPTPAEAEDEVSEDRTELFVRRDSVAMPERKKEAEQTITKRERAEAARASTEIHAQGTAAAASETQRSTKPQKEPSPFKKKYVETEISDAGDELSDEVANSDSDFPGFQETPQEGKAAAERPFARDPARSDKTDKRAPAVEVADAGVEATPTPRPFGDATFLAIQKMGSGKQGKRRALVAFSLILIVIAGFFLLTRGPSDSTQRDLAMAPSMPSGTKLNRPNRWYEDEPQVFQRFLAQMATLPQSEQIQPKNRALIAEALVLNGHLTGNFDQVAQGIGFASSLVVSTPQEVFGYYGLAMNAILKDDTATLTDLINRWPAPNRGDLEFKLGSLLVGARSGQKVAAIELGRTMIEESGASNRLGNIVLAAAAESWTEAQQILGEKLTQDLVKAFVRKKESFEKSGAPAPDFYTNLERKLQRKGVFSQSVAKAPPAPTPKSEDAVTQRLNQRAAEKMQSAKANPPTPSKPELKVEPKPEPVAIAKAPELASPGSTNPSAPPAVPAPPAATPAPTAPPAKPAPTKLPKPTEQLMAQNKQDSREESEAAKLFRQGSSFLQANKTDEAIVSFQKSLRFDPDYAESYKKLGEIYMKKQDKERALRSFKIYLQLKPDSADKQVVEGWISSLQ